MKLAVTLQGDEINRLQFPIVVEMWKRVKGSGIKRKEYMKTFKESYLYIGDDGKIYIM